MVTVPVFNPNKYQDDTEMTKLYDQYLIFRNMIRHCATENQKPAKERMDSWICNQNKYIDPCRPNGLLQVCAITIYSLPRAANKPTVMLGECPANFENEVRAKASCIYELLLKAARPILQYGVQIEVSCQLLERQQPHWLEASDHIG